MKKIKAVLGMITRQYRSIVVEVPDDYDKWSESEQEEMLSNIYSEDDALSGWVEDTEWGSEEGTHSIIGPASDNLKSDFVINEYKHAKVIRQ